MFTRSQNTSQTIELTSSSGNFGYADEEGGLKRKVPVKAYLLILIGVLIATLVGLCIGLYFIGVSSGVASVSTLPPAPTNGPTNAPTNAATNTPSKEPTNTNSPTTAVTLPAATTTTPVNFTGTPNLDYRLPRVAAPSHYKVALFPNIYTGNESTFLFDGWEIITFKPLVLTDRIFLHSSTLSISDAQLYENLPDSEEPLPWIGSSQSNKKGDIALVQQYYHAQFQFYELVFNKTLELRDYKLKLSWSGPLRRDLYGLYFSRYTSDEKTVYIVGSQLEATYARKVFPCFDEPDFKAVFETRLVRDKNFKSISNNEFIETKPVQIFGVDYDMDLFLPTVPQSSYLNAYAVHQYEYLKTYDSDRKIEYRFWCRVGWTKRIEYVANITSQILNYMDNLYGTQYPFSKMDFYPIPDFAAGAMENWGLVTFAENSYYYDPERDPLSVKERVALVAVHEIGHMNFGNIVTTKWWDDIWLNEGYAAYYEFVGVNALEPSWDYEDRFLVGTVLRAMKYDCTNATRPLTQQAYTPSSISALFDTIAYAKGGSINRMMEGFLSYQTFTKGLSVYLYTFKYNNAEHKNLFDALTAQTVVENKHIDMNKVMQGWTLQPGYPVLTAQFDSAVANKLTLKVSQAPFELDKGKFGSRTWSIPINSVVSTNAGQINPTLDWLHTDQGTIEIADGSITDAWDGWFILNPDHRGYYRINYDSQNWEKLITQLYANHTVFSKYTRLQLVDDALNLARGNYSTMRYPLALKLTSYLCKDTDYPPWQATLDNIDYMEQMFTQNESDAYIKRYGRIMINSVYEFVGWEGNNEEPTWKHFLRMSVLPRACRWQSQNCTTVAKFHFNEWKNNQSYVLPRDGSSTARCYGIKNGTMDDWWWLYELYTKTTVQSDRNSYINALGCSDNTTLLEWFLDKSLSSTANVLQEFGTIWAGVAANPTSRKMITEYFYTNWERLMSLTESVAQKVLETTFQYVNTDAELQRLQEWKQNEGIPDKVESTYNRLMVTIGVNIAWMKEHGQEVDEWIKDFDENPKLPPECTVLSF